MFSIIKISRSWDRLIFTQGIPILARRRLYIGTATRISIKFVPRKSSHYIIFEHVEGQALCERNLLATSGLLSKGRVVCMQLWLFMLADKVLNIKACLWWWSETFWGSCDVAVLSLYIFCSTRARFTNDFLPAIQIRWKLRLAVIPLLAIRSQQIFEHATTAQLSCHVHNFVAITL